MTIAQFKRIKRIASKMWYYVEYRKECTHDIDSWERYWDKTRRILLKVFDGNALTGEDMMYLNNRMESLSPNNLYSKWLKSR